MDVLLNDDENMVLDQARAFLSATCTPALVRECELQQSHSSDLWKEIIDLGWVETCLPEEIEGLGLPIHYMSLLFEEVGRSLAPVPLLSAVIPSLIIAKHGSSHHANFLNRARKGQALLSFAFQENNGSWFSDSINMVGRVDGDSVVLNGKKLFVDNFEASERCLVAFRMDGQGSGVSLGLVDTSTPGISREALVPTAKDCEFSVCFDEVRIPLIDVIGTIGNADTILSEAMNLATLFGTAQLVGAARKTIEMAVEYANQRIAFEQPVGSFQAIQHLCADMLIGVDGAELLCREAAWKMGTGKDASVEISQAKAFANEKCVMACRSSQQIHGGMGFMMEFDLQLWYRRVVSGSLRYGTTSEHRSRVAAHLLKQHGSVRLDDFIAG
jgi:alkylation response protein AidB-like acyl-CoA dehydrogenase